MPLRPEDDAPGISARAWAFGLPLSAVLWAAIILGVCAAL